MVEAHQSQFERCVEFGNQLVSNDHFATTEILGNIDELQKMWSNIEQEWDDRKTALTECLKIQVLDYFL